ncbi:MAG: putative ATPase [Dactylosporangium sp.]|jgi:hypothetical protein|nr:putative ATPase [Dactylosporangium sp.]
MDVGLAVPAVQAKHRPFTVLIVKLRRVTMAALVAAGVAAVTLMIGLVTNAASDQERWPGWLHRTGFDFEELTAGAVAALAKLRRKPQERGWRARIDRALKRV